MKPRLLWLLTLVLCVHITGFAQAKFSATFRNASAEQAIQILKKATGYDFVYQKDLINKNTATVTGTYRDTAIGRLLDATIDQQLGLSYKIVDKTISLAEPDKQSYAYDALVTGTVTDEAGEPLAGATVMLKGTNYGTSADIDGNFAIQIHHTDPSLEFSYVGMHPQTVRLTAKNIGKRLNITLQTNASTMDEVVVTGYQNIKRENATGAYQQISSDELDMRSISQLSQNLEGKIAGMVVYNDDIQIRGTGSLNASTTPLIVVDGLPIEGTLDNVNPYDVDKITVLKDAAAAAIYGARASNGVIVISTKKGVSENLAVEFNADFTLYDKPDYDNMNLVNAQELLFLEEQNFNWMMAREDVRKDYEKQYGTRGSLWNPMNRLMMRHHLGEISDADYSSQIARWSNNSYSSDYSDLSEHTRFQQRYNVALRTNGKHLNNNITVTWTGDNTNEVNSYDNKLTLRYLGDINVTKWFNATIGLQLDNTRQKGNYHAQYDYCRRSAFPEYLSIWNPDGTPARLQAAVSLDEPSLSDPTLELKDEGYVAAQEFGLNLTKYRETYTRGFVHLNFFPIPELKLSGMFQYEDATYKRENNVDAESYTARHLYNLFTYKGKHLFPEGGILDATNNTQNAYTFRAQATYDKTLFGKHAVNAVAGLEYRHQRIKTDSHRFYGYNPQTLVHSTGNMNFKDLNNASSTDLGSLYSASSGYTPSDLGSIRDLEHKFFSYYFTANYTYDHRYTASGSFRIDQADLFGADKKFTRRPLWSVGASWNAHNEAFIRDIAWISMLKPRLSYGVTGNINSNYTSYLTASISNNTFIGDKYASISVPPNDQLRWEKTKTFDLGVDFGLWDYRLNGSIDYYNKQGSDILSLVDTDPTTGWTSLNMNNAGTRNRGVELQLSSQIIRPAKAKQFGLNIQMTLAYNNNKVTSINHVAKRGVNAIAPNDYKEDRPVNSLYSFRYDGVRYDDDGFGHIRWKGADGESHEDALSSANFKVEDVLFSGGLDPKWSGSFTPTVTWNNFSVSAMTAFYLGHYFRPNANKWEFESGSSYSNLPTREYLNYWKASESERANMIGNGYMMSRSTFNSFYMTYSDGNIAHADYLKIRNIVVSYSFDKQICRKIGMSSLRLRAQINNVATWARNHDGIDPERVNPITGAWSVGTPRSYTFSISANF